MRKQLYFIIFIIILYLFLFDPPFFMFRGVIRFSNILLVLAFIYVIHYGSEVARFYRIMRKEVYMFSFLFLFVVIRSSLEGDVSFINKTMMAYLNIIMVTPAILLFAKKLGYGSEEHFLKALLIAGSIATIITIVCLLNPSFQDYVRNQIIQVGEKDYIYNNDYRGFGIASAHTSNYGFTLGFLTGLGCFYLTQNKWFLYCIPFMIIAGLVNSRTSLIIAAAMIIIFLVRAQKKLYAFFVGCLGFLLFTYFDSFILIFGLSDRTYEWLMSFQQQMMSVAESGDLTASHAGSEIFGRMIIWPETTEQWIIGRGYDIFRAKGEIGNSDNGWIRQLNYGGIIYLLIFYSIFTYMLRRLKRYKQWSYLFVFLMVFVITNTKTTAFPSTQLFTLMMIVYYFKVKRTVIAKKVSTPLIAKR